MGLDAVELRFASPGLDELVTRIFSREDAAFLARAYTASQRAGRPDFFEREEGVSFNPQAARLAQLYITECERRDAVGVAAAFFLAAGAPDCGSEFSQPMALDSRVLSALKLPSRESLASLTPALLDIAQVYLLDLLRHAHQLPSGDRVSVLQRAADFLNAHGSFSRLRLSRLLRRYLLKYELPIPEADVEPASFGV
jgi:hypothetical protein